ncbi:GSTZ1 family protein [Megaselia abdita]
MSKPLLYSCWMSSCAWRVRIALHLKQIDFNVKTISILKTGEPGDQYSEEFEKINPMKYIPALEIQSLSIINYLEEAYPKRRLLPKDIFQRTKARAISDVICSGIQPLQNLKVQKFSRPDGNLNFEWASFWISQGFSSLENILKESTGDYCVGNEITMADCCLVPQVANARRYKIEVSSYPTIARIDKALQDHEAFRKAHPSQQPDFPKEVPASFASQFK